MKHEYKWFYIHNDDGFIQFTGTNKQDNPLHGHPDKNPKIVKASDLYEAVLKS